MLAVLAVLGVRASSIGDGSCNDVVDVWSDGARTGAVCVDDVDARGLLVVDLGDDWVPFFLDGGDGDPAPWRATFVALANERFDDPGVGRRASVDRFFETWGIPPSPSVLQRRLDDDGRHACDDTVDDGGLATAPLPLRPSALAHPSARALAIARLQRRRDAGRADVAELARLAALTVVDGAARAVLGHLVCEGFLAPRDAQGGFGPRATMALAAFQRREALAGVAGVIDDDTRARLLSSSRTRDWLALLRTVRERVADAAGLIEDGSAADVEASVAGQRLDARTVRAPLRKTALAGAAPDVLDTVTDGVVRALGLQDEATAADVLRSLPRGRVAVPYAGRPAWHGPAMNLDVTIDPGDVDRDGLWRPGMQRLPMLVVTAVVDEADTQGGEARRVPLVRWPTTVGGWQRERGEDGVVFDRRKPSPSGDVVWAHVWAQPAWYAPPTTPDDDLLLHVEDGFVVNDDVIGPGYRSAYGLVMVPHERARSRRLGDPLGDEPGDASVDELGDTAVRTHGTGNVRSVLRGGPSHGCHRLLPVHASRLATFLLRHRAHRRDGLMRQTWERTFDDVGLVARRRLRGVRWTLTPPLWVRVLPASTTPARSTTQPALAPTTPPPRPARRRGRGAGSNGRTRATTSTQSGAVALR